MLPDDPHGYIRGTRRALIVLVTVMAAGVVFSAGLVVGILIEGGTP